MSLWTHFGAPQGCGSSCPWQPIPLHSGSGRSSELGEELEWGVLETLLVPYLGFGGSTRPMGFGARCLGMSEGTEQQNVGSWECPNAT